jgi:hypothetical protein
VTNHTENSQAYHDAKDRYNDEYRVFRAAKYLYSIGKLFNVEFDQAKSDYAAARKAYDAAVEHEMERLGVNP